jgi:alpha-tubulin suppressor-like RCC1 family protein
VTAGTSNSCALFDNGTVRCWALNNPEGAGTTNIQADSNGIVAPDAVGDADLDGERAFQISTGSVHTCAVLESGALKCWGRSLTTESLSFGGLRTERVSVAGVGACAVLQGGIVRCWGSGYPGPTQNINTGGQAVAVSIGLGRACAALSNGQLRCWGSNSNGELGLGHTRTIAFDAPLTDSIVDVGGPVRSISMSVNGAACALLQNGTLRCWGSNGASGSLGYRHTQNIGDLQTPAQAAQPGGLGGSLDFGQGRGVLMAYEGRCALRDDGELFCWGASLFGEQGNPTFFPNGTGARTPADVGPVQFQ